MKTFSLSLLPAVLWLAAASIPALAAEPGGVSTAWGTYQKPYAARSPWNSRPINPVLGSAVIPPAQFNPIVHEGAYSTGVFKATTQDAPVTILGPKNSNGILDADMETYRQSISLERWPKDVVPATGNDGHADIIDEVTGIVHSFYRLKKDGDVWRASFYAWSKLDGRGWGDPGHFYQGARATGVPPSAGLIRRHEINDGDVMYRHALAMSLTYNALSATPGYVYPATSADATAKQNTGSIPEGSLLMLPREFDVGTLSSPQLRKIAETLKVYGAYVVDRNVGTPYAIYVETGANIGLNVFTPKLISDLQLIRKELRPLSTSEGWIDGNGQQYQDERRFSLGSLRGTWSRMSGDGVAVFDSWQQAVVITGATKTSTFSNSKGRFLTKLAWSEAQPGKRYKMQVHATGGGAFKLSITDLDAKRTVYSSGLLRDGDVQNITWPANKLWVSLGIQVPGGQTSTISVDFQEAE